MGNGLSKSHRRRSKVLLAAVPTQNSPPPPYSKDVQTASPTLVYVPPPWITEDALETLRIYDTVIIVDDSGSMQGERWKEAGSALAELAEVAAYYDANGIDIFFINSKTRGEGLKDPNQVRKIFDRVVPTSNTLLGMVMHRHLKNYVNKIESDLQTRRCALDDSGVKPVNYIIITDGMPSDPEELENAIVKCAQWLDKHEQPLNQLGIQFVQVGNSGSAAEYLEHLDTALKTEYNIRDMVDTEPYRDGSKDSKLGAERLIKILLGGINRRVDVKGGAALSEQDN
ncbi:hypothetical protein CONPUDRAFT_158389 [Coniophora puteana RWD-64-598 SS2]|uniref:VWFA domain-containing protein n=1 Tax=Coniophora puteana (strain RWD-64-598) TaxID=741705 RepID=A0A5M3MCJ9_CONPW|nr:uncharacterized protein CONPUDRAFT_158389 [Coniophora puteana RWD-64-598 SS2]EIW76365.1 hypothetical protein CONPUDRAFT_158389 [Coniophora puteana RWD-64-598 SS2]